MIDGLPPMPLPARSPSAPAADAAPTNDFAAWLQAEGEAPTDAPADDAAGTPPLLPSPLGAQAPALADDGIAPVDDAVLPPPTMPTDVEAMPRITPTPVGEITMRVSPIRSTPAPAPVAERLMDGARPVAQLEHAVPDATLVVDAAAGQIEIVSPWRLIADGSLSYRGRDGLPAGGGSIGRAPGAASGTVRAGDGGMSAAVVRDLPLPVTTSPSNTGVVPPSPRREASANGATDAVENAAHASTTSHSASWTMRLLRWFEAEGRGATAWLRDYTLTADGETRLVDDLRRFATSEGLPLARIVLNGRTLWSADPSPLHEHL